MVPRIRVFGRGVAMDWYWDGLLCALVIYVCITHWLFLLCCATGSSSTCSLLDLLLALSVCYSVESKQVDCEPVTQPLWNSVLAFLARTEMLLVLDKWCCRHPVPTQLACLSVEEKGSSKFQLLAFAVQKRVRAQSQLDLVSSGRWVI